MTPPPAVIFASPSSTSLDGVCLLQTKTNGGIMVPETFDWNALARVLFRFPPPHWLFFHCPSLKGYDVIPLCYFQSFFDVLVFCSHFPSPSANTGNSAACASPSLLLCHSLDTSFRPTTQCRTISSAPNLLPRPASSSHVGACPSTHPRSFFLFFSLFACSECLLFRSACLD